MKAKRCVYDGGFIIQRTQTQWVCGSCGLPYGAGLMTDKAVWSEFRRRSLAVLALEREDKSDEEIRPLLGVLLTGVLGQMKKDNL